MRDSNSTGSDPRQPSTAKPYVPPPISSQDLPVDYAGFLAVVLGVIGVMFRVLELCGRPIIKTFLTRHDEKLVVICVRRCSIVVFVALMLVRRVALGQYKLFSWLAIIFCAESLVNMKNFENDLKQISMAMMFAIMGLVTNYFGPKRPPKTQP